MARNATDVAEARVKRAKDKVNTLSAALELARLEAARSMRDALDAQTLKRSQLADLWHTSIAQVDRMIAKARAERG